MAAITLGRAVQFTNGNWDVEAWTWMTRAMMLAVFPAFLGQGFDRFARLVLPLVLMMGLAFQLAMLMTHQPGMYLRQVPSAPLPHFYYGIAVAGVAGACTLASLDVRWFKHLAVPMLLVTFVFMGRWILTASPEPVIDVFHIHRESLAAFLKGENPYTLTFQNIYGGSQYFGPGMVENGRLMFGFTYPPVSLFLALPGHVLMGDYRWSLMIASAAAGALIAYSRPGPIPKALAAIYLFTPRHFFVLEQGWTEPFIVFLVALTVFIACRRPKLLWVPLGLLVLAKQYVILAVPAVFLLRTVFATWREFWVTIAKGAALAAVLTLPLALWNFPAFWRDLVGIQLGLPFRPDALSFPVWWLKTYGEMAPGGLAIALAFCISALVWVRAPRTVSGFAWATAVLFFTFFAFRQSFCNYYFLTIGCLCAAAAAALPKDPIQLGGGA